MNQQTDLIVHAGRQVLISAMTFNCSGSITKWMLSALWEGNSLAFTELQLWRKSSNTSNVHFKVGATTIRVNSENYNQLYEVSVGAPLAFLAGDILGYFQPNDNIAQLNLLLEDSAGITTFRDNVAETQTLPSTGVFDLDASRFLGEDYALIGAETDMLCVFRLSSLVSRASRCRTID